MDPNTKLLLDELKSMKTFLESSLGGRIGEVEASLGKRIGAVEHSIADRFNRPKDAAKVFDEWKPKVDAIRKSDASVEQMREEMTALRKTVSRVVLDSDPSASAGVLKPQPVVAAETSSAGHPTIGPFVGHDIALHHRGFEPTAQPSVKGKLIQTLPQPTHQYVLHRSLSSSTLDVGDWEFHGAGGAPHEHRAH